jgi:uncharacterized protein GlcG (DUF336 family)
MLGVKTLGNAILIAYEDGPILATDPWFGDEHDAFFGSWWLPHRIPATEKTDIQKAKYIWFSHGHPDHLNPQSIERFRHSSILLPDHVGGRIKSALEAQNYDINVLPDGDWVQLSKRIRVCCISDHIQDAILLVDVAGHLFINMNDAAGNARIRFIRNIAREFRHSYLLRASGALDMINFCDANGNRIEPETPPMGRWLALLAQRVGAQSVVPFSSFHRYQREDSAWANAYRKPLSAYREGFDETLAEYIPPFVWINCTSHEIIELNPPEAPYVLHKPEEFGDSWSDELSLDDKHVLDAYFLRKEALNGMLGFITFSVGEKSHTIDLGGPRHRGLTFEAPRNSLMTAVTYNVFDDLLGSNFMKATLHNVESLYSPNFNLVVGKYGDNGLAETKAEIKAYLTEYRRRCGTADWLLYRLTSEGGLVIPPLYKKRLEILYDGTRRIFKGIAQLVVGKEKSINETNMRKNSRMKLSFRLAPGRFGGGPRKVTILAREPPGNLANVGLKEVSCMKPSLLSALCALLLVSQAHAQGLIQTHRISADLANQAVAAVVAKCASQGYAETGVLVDADGVQQAVLRGDHAGAHTLDSAFAKAYTAASFKTDTTALVERSKTVPVLANLFKLPHLMLLSGGIVIKLGDEVVGAIGAGGAPGGDLDDACARAGLDKIKDQLK